jgi:hypothetical protein
MFICNSVFLLCSAWWGKILHFKISSLRIKTIVSRAYGRNKEHAAGRAGIARYISVELQIWPNAQEY